MNLFPQDFVSPLVPLIGTLVSGEMLNQWESRLSLSLGGEVSSRSLASNSELQGTGPLFKLVKLSKVAAP